MEKVAKNELRNKTYYDFIEAFWILYEKKNINKIRVREICEIAGYNRSTFYNHFIDVYDVLDHIENNILEEFSELLNDGYLIFQRDDSAKRFSRLYEKNEKFLKGFANDEKGSHFSYKLIKLFDKELGERIYITGNKNDNDLAREYHIYGSVAMIMKYFRGETDISIEDIIDFALKSGTGEKRSVIASSHMDKKGTFVD